MSQQLTDNPEPPWGGRTPTPSEWMTWIDGLDSEKLPDGKLRDLVRAREFQSRWNPYGLFDLGIDLDDEPEAGDAS